MAWKTKMFAEKQFAWIIVACICMWGCSEDHIRWNEGFSGTKIVGFVDDSLAMVGSYQLRTESHEGTFEPYWDVIESGHERLCVYNYRVQENGPRWCDTLDEYNMTNAFRGQMTDSIVWGGDVPNVIRLWKIGESQHQIKLKKTIENCSGEFEIASVKQWLDGKFFARGKEFLNVVGDSCQYAILDTVERMITYKRLDDELKWIEKCDDVRAWNEGVYCLALLNEPKDLYLIKNNVFLDSLLQGTPYEWASYTKVGFSGSILNLGNNIFKIVEDKLFSNGVSIKNALEYKLENGNYITY